MLIVYSSPCCFGEKLKTFATSMANETVEQTGICHSASLCYAHVQFMIVYTRTVHDVYTRTVHDCLHNFVFIRLHQSSHSTRLSGHINMICLVVLSGHINMIYLVVLSGHINMIYLVVLSGHINMIYLVVLFSKLRFVAFCLTG